MIRSTLLVALIALALGAQPAAGADCPSTPAIEANECLVREIPVVEKAVQQQYREMLSAFPVNLPEPEAKRLLDASQKAWLSYRTTHCRYIGQVEGGDLYKGVYEGFCLLETAKRRVAEMTQLRRHAYE